MAKIGFESFKTNYFLQKLRLILISVRISNFETIFTLFEKKRMAQKWYKTWFDSEYYHLLYSNRDEEEADKWIDELVHYLHPSKGSKICDLACGKGRHSKFLSQKGFDVTGLDLSVNSISEARLMEEENLHFFSHDMRKPFRYNYFDYVFNFFTSFGYFEKDKDNLDTLISVRKGLKNGGVFVLDYFNSIYLEENIVQVGEKTVEGVHFSWNKTISNGFIKKKIDFIDNGENFTFTESVRLFKIQELIDLFEKAGLQPFAVFGDYSLNPFHPNKSPRLILVAHKK
jgi:SAM-dependent methyltransferase